MLVHIRNVLTADQVARCLEALARAPWIDGRRSAGPTAAQAKHNMEADLTDPTVRGWSDGLQQILKTNPAFMAGALPAKICPPSFNRYEHGQTYGIHNDAALFDFSGLGQGWVRGDLAATLFLSAPEDYDGGELMIADTFGPLKVKLPAGDMVLYPASSQHQVAPVTRGARVAAYFWMQSLVRDETQRQLLRDLDSSIMQLNQAVPGHEATLQLLGLYHNLLRMWSDT